MLKRLLLQNFKCFHNHEIPFRPTTILVGRNNAGKSTIVEALRLVSLVINRYQFLSYRGVPDWLDIPTRSRGVSPSLKGMEFSFDSVFHRYGDPPAAITAEFDTGETVKVYIGPDVHVHAVIEDSTKQLITTKGQAQKIQLPEVNILPQVAPLAREEQILTPDYVRSALSSALAPLHFRNQLNLFYDFFFEDFKQIAEDTWPGLRITELTGRSVLPGGDLSLLVQDGDFVAEVGLMGHGLQMWLQAMWFLARIKKESTVILDEPDVYMHADLQRRLIRLLRSHYNQNIIATHSTEIMSEVEADQVLIVDRKENKSKFTTSLSAVQSFIEHIGGTHNIQLARLWSSKRFILVEGKDVRIFKRLQNILFPDSREPFDTIPNMSIGGWGGWNYAIGSSMVLKNEGGQDITTYCIFDSDYHIAEDINKRHKDAKKRGVQLHIWSRKEIENYLLVPEAIQRVVSSGIRGQITPPSTERITKQIDKIAKSLKNSVMDAISTEFLASNKAGGVRVANSAARKQVEDAWKSREGRFSIVSGKKVISKLSEWSQKKFDVSISATAIVRALRINEIPDELVTVLSAIEECKTFVS
jgi:hypothetical protein